MLRLLEKHGWKKDASQTPWNSRPRFPRQLSAHIAQMTELYQSARFGSAPVPVAEMSSLLRSIRDSLNTRKTSQQ